MFVSLYAGQAPAAAGKPQDERCSIEGRVVNSVNGEAVKRVTLVLAPPVPTSLSDIRTTESDDNGQFAFQNLNPGRYTLLARRTGFATQVYGAKNNPLSGPPLILSPSQRVEGIVFNLGPSAVISGRVLDSEGEPMGSVTVFALRSSFRLGERQWLPLETAQTNDLGEFRLIGLSAGIYAVAATRTTMAASLFGPSGKPPSDKPEVGFALTYYPNARDAYGAVPIRLEAGAETRADLWLLRTPTVRLSGKLAGGVGGLPIMVLLVPQGGGALGLNAGKRAVVRQSGGGFELTDVAPGSYTLIGATSELQSALVAARPIQVGDQNVEGILLQIGSDGGLSGVVAMEGKDAVDLEEIRILLQSRDFVSMNARPGYPDEEGKFTLRNLAPGRYLVKVNNAPEGSYVKSVRFGGREVTEEGLDLTGGVSGSLQITLSPEAAQVDGVVQDADNKPVTGATVVLIPDSRRFSLYKEEHTDQNGRFSMKGLTPGNYKLLAWEDIETGAFYDPEFLKKYESKAESLSLKPSDRRNIQVKAIPFEKLP